VSIVDAIAHASWLRSRVSAHKLKYEFARVLSVYDVSNAQFFARRLLLESLRLWRTSCSKVFSRSIWAKRTYLAAAVVTPFSFLESVLIANDLHGPGRALHRGKQWLSASDPVKGVLKRKKQTNQPVLVTTLRFGADQVRHSDVVIVAGVLEEIRKTLGRLEGLEDSLVDPRLGIHRRVIHSEDIGNGVGPSRVSRSITCRLELC
jgi:hypothetical protein